MSDILFQDVEGKDHGDQQLCGLIVNKLTQEYPKYRWAAFVNDDRTVGMVIIVNVDINPDFDKGYHLKLKDVYNDPEMKLVMRAGGEIIERAYMPWKFTGELPGKVDGMSDAELIKARLSKWTQ